MDVGNLFLHDNEISRGHYCEMKQCESEVFVLITVLL